MIHAQLPLRMPCYDLVPVTDLTFNPPPLEPITMIGVLDNSKSEGSSGITGSLDLTGGVYKARERIHRTMADARLLAIPASCGRVAALNPN